MKMRHLIKFPAVLLTMALCISISAAQLSGPLNGLLETGIHEVVSDISVEIGDTLTIEPGTVLLFSGIYGFDIKGNLQALGTASDSILFLPNVGNAYWRGITFHSSSDSNSVMSYSLISGGAAFGSFPYNCGGGVACYGANPTISNSTITDNYTEGHGGGIACIAGA
ncbi:MAG: hypothetical protein ABH878_02970, partial [bacterium]